MRPYLKIALIAVLLGTPVAAEEWGVPDNLARIASVIINGVKLTGTSGTGNTVALTGAPAFTGAVSMPTLSGNVAFSPTTAGITGTTTNDNATAGTVGESIACYANPGGSPNNPTTVTITIASPAVVTWNANNLTLNSPVVFATSGALPTGLSAATTYYVSSVVSANTFQVSATIGGASINTSGTQSGTQTAISEVTLSTGNPFNICAVSLTAGDWQINSVGYFDGGGTTTIVYLGVTVGTVSATFNQTFDNFSIAAYPTNSFASVNPVTVKNGAQRFSLSSPATIYLVEQASFATSTLKGYGALTARRVR